MSKRVFAIGAHPDDIEFFMAGTWLALGRRGYELHYMSVANGSCGSITMNATETADCRLNELKNAAKSAGAVFHAPLTADLEIFYERSILARLTSIVREVEPEILLVPAYDDYMEDHINTCRLAVSAAFCRGMPNFPVDPPRKVTKQQVTVYHAQPNGNMGYLGKPAIPDFYVNIEDTMDLKIKMLSEHKSQKEWLDVSQGMDSYLAMSRDLSLELGRWSKRFKYAEGWTRHNHLGMCDAGADPIGQALKDLVHKPG